MCLSPLLGAVNLSVLEKQQKNNSTRHRTFWSSISGKNNSERVLGWGSMGLQLLVTILTNFTTNNHHFESAIYSKKIRVQKVKPGCRRVLVVKYIQLLSTGSDLNKLGKASGLWNTCSGTHIHAISVFS